MRVFALSTGALRPLSRDALHNVRAPWSYVVAAHAHDLAHVLADYRHPALNILPVRYRLKVPRIHTAGNTTEVVKVEAIGDSATVRLVAHSVGAPRVCFPPSALPETNRNNAVTVRIKGANPQPATTLRYALYVALEALHQRHWPPPKPVYSMASRLVHLLTLCESSSPRFAFSSRQRLNRMAQAAPWMALGA